MNNPLDPYPLYHACIGPGRGSSYVHTYIGRDRYFSLAFRYYEPSRYVGFPAQWVWYEFRIAHTLGYRHPLAESTSGWS